MGKRGKFITLEGGEGVGKSTLLADLRAKLRARGIAVQLAREPGGTALGEAVRALLLDPASRSMSAESELLLMFASRAQLVRELVLPTLKTGGWVLSDRYVDASYAYQGGGRLVPDARICALEEWVCAGLKPDLTLLLDLPVSTGRARIVRRGNIDRIETETDAFFERVRERYRRRAAAESGRFCVIDASLAPAQVLQASMVAVNRLIKASA